MRRQLLYLVCLLSCLAGLVVAQEELPLIEDFIESPAPIIDVPPSLDESFLDEPFEITDLDLEPEPDLETLDSPRLEAPPELAPEPEASEPVARLADLSGDNQQLDSTSQAALDASPSSEAITGAEQGARNASTIGSLLDESSTIQTISAQRRSPVSFDPRVRGFHGGQIYTQGNGELFFPVRQDLDSMLSKLEPAYVDEILVVPGPYGVRYGPGFSFIDVKTRPTPRFQCPDATGTFGLTYHTNGSRVFSRAAIEGGGKDWGYILNYSARVGSDYTAGNGQAIPSSYDNRNVLAQFGFDLNRDWSLEFRFNRLDQTDTEYAGQVFDIDFLGSNSFNFDLEYNGIYFWDRINYQAWYNETNYFGDTDNKSRADFPILQRLQRGLPTLTSGSTNGRGRVAGGRMIMFHEGRRGRSFTSGADIRYISQRLFENFRFDGSDDINTNLPGGRMLDPGVFAEWSFPLRRKIKTTVGARADFIFSRANASELRTTPGNESNFEADELADDDVLYSVFINNEVTLSKFTTFSFGFGHGQRPATLIEKYADGLFLGLNQSGFSRVIGSPDLRHERLFQFDAGLSIDRPCWSFRINPYWAWVLDYITYVGNNDISEIPGARLLRFTNTDLAFLTGMEVYGDRKLNNNMTIFGSLGYTYGEDKTIQLNSGVEESGPLYGIPPLEGRLGFRLHDYTGGDVWQIEAAARIVNDQDRVGVFREGNVSNTVGVEDLESATPGFTTFYVRGYYNVGDRARILAGVENIFDQSYLEHLDLRLPGVPASGTQAALPGLRVLSPGRSLYFGVERRF